MLLKTGICVSIVIFCCCTLVQAVQGGSRVYRTDIESYISHVRTRRSQSAAAKLGLKALNTLMDGAWRTSMKMNPQTYMKKGGILNALEDFYSVFPEKVGYFRQPGKIFGQSGSIGDRTLIVKGGENSKITLEIFKTDDPTAVRHQITYSKKAKKPQNPEVGPGNFWDY